MTETRDDRIRARAYDLWQTDGSKAGDDWAYWLQAEREISEEDAAVAIPAKEPIKKASPKKPPASKSAAAAKPTAAKPAAPKAVKPAAKPAAKGKTKADAAAPAPGKR